VTARMIILLGLFLALTASACGGKSAERGAGPPEPRPPALYTVGRSLLGAPGLGQVRLAAPPVAPLAGWLTPAAVPSPDGRLIAYNAWRELRRDDPSQSWEDQGISPGDPLARPSIRLHDLESGDDRVLAAGAFSLAWRADGALAYFQGAGRSYRAGVPYVGNVVVRASTGSPARRWTPSRARYVVVGWAGATLIAYVEHEGEALDVLALAGPGKVRRLARGAGVVAISPDGSKVLLERGPEAGAPRVELVSVASGARLASLDLTTVDPAIGVVGYAGDWEGSLAVAPSSTGLAVFAVTGRRITVIRAIRVAGEHSVAEPRFAAAGRITGWTSTAAGGAFVDCKRVTGRCGRAVPLPASRGTGGYPTWRRPVYNPSRPQEGDR
jgi:hypothetical protein